MLHRLRTSTSILTALLAVVATMSPARPARAQSYLDYDLIATNAAEQRGILLERLDASRETAPGPYDQLLTTLSDELDRALNALEGSGSSNWRFRTLGEALFQVAVLWVAPDSPYQDSPELLAGIIEGLDYLTENQSTDGSWQDGDPNIERFTLMPAIDALVLASERLSLMEEWSSWVDMLYSAGAHQRGTYPADSRFRHYPNMDAYYAACMILLGILSGDTDWIIEGRTTIDASAHRCLHSDGAFEYTAGLNPVPVYQDVTLAMLGRMYLATLDDSFIEYIAPSSEYYTYYPEVSGATDAGMVPFYKHYWNYGNLASPRTSSPIVSAPELVAFLTGDRRCAALAQRRIDNYAARPGTAAHYYHALSLLWLSGVPTEELPREFLRSSPGIAGFEQRVGGNWTTWITGRRAPRDSVVSALASAPDADPFAEEPFLDAAVAGVIVEVNADLWEGLSMARARLLLLSDDGGPGLGAYYVGVPPTGAWEQVEFAFRAPSEATRLGLQLFQTKIEIEGDVAVLWDEVEIVMEEDGSEGENLLENGGFDEPGTAGGNPWPWQPKSWGTASRCDYLTEGCYRRWCVRALTKAPDQRASWGLSVNIEPVKSYVFRAWAKTKTRHPMEPETYPFYLSDTEPLVNQAQSTNAVGQTYRTKLHALGQQTRFPSVAGAEWLVHYGGSTKTAPLSNFQVWLLADGLLMGRVVLTSWEDAAGQGCIVRIPTYPHGVTITGSSSGGVHQYRTSRGDIVIAGFDIEGGLEPIVVAGPVDGQERYGEELQFTDRRDGETVSWPTGHRVALTLAFDRLDRDEEDLANRIEAGRLVSFAVDGSIVGIGLCAPDGRRVRAAFANDGAGRVTLSQDSLVEHLVSSGVCDGETQLEIVETAPEAEEGSFLLEPGDLVVVEAEWLEVPPVDEDMDADAPNDEVWDEDTPDDDTADGGPGVASGGCACRASGGSRRANGFLGMLAHQ